MIIPSRTHLMLFFIQYYFGRKPKKASSPLVHKRKLYSNLQIYKTAGAD